MNKEKLTKILKQTDPPRPVLNKRRAQLRRDLLNAPYYRKSHFWQRLFSKPYLIRSLATLLILLAIIVPNMIPREMSARELLANLENAYDRAAIAGKIHYLQVYLKSFSDKIEPYTEQRWIYDNYRQFRAQVKDANSGEIIGHTIIRGDSTYNRGSDENFIYDIKVMTETEIPAGQAEMTEDVFIYKNDKVEDNLDVRILPAEEQDQQKNLLEILLTNNSFDYQAFSRQTPQDVIARLKQDPLIAYDGKSTDPESGIELAILARENPNGGFKLQLEDHPEVKKDIRRISRLLTRNGLNGLDESEIKRYGVTPLISLELIRVDAERNRIHSIFHLLKQGETVVERSELYFSEETFLDFDPVIFDPKRFGLIPAVIGQ